MPALKPTGVAGRILWLGSVGGDDGILSAPRTTLRLDFAGAEGEAHSGLTRPACSRVAAQHPRGTPIRNTRQLSIVAREELGAIAAAIGLASLDPALLGASVLIEGIPDFTLVPPSSRLQGPDGVTLVIDMENRPCNLPARAIEDRHPGAGARFKAAARHRRGVTAWVERPGVLALGDELRLHIPDQPVWPHLGAVRG